MLAQDTKKPSVLRIHGATVIHLDPIEHAILEELVQQGRAVVLPDEES